MTEMTRRDRTDLMALLGRLDVPATLDAAVAVDPSGRGWAPICAHAVDKRGEPFSSAERELLATATDDEIAAGRLRVVPVRLQVEFATSETIDFDGFGDAVVALLNAYNISIGATITLSHDQGVVGWEVEPTPGELVESP
jgi:hypothetical protein